MAIVKIVNWEGGSNARYDLNQMTPEERTHFDSEGRPLYAGAPGDGPGQWTPGLPGARGGSGPNDGGGDGGGGGGGLPPGAAAAIAQELALAKQAYDTALAKITNQRQSLGRNAGFTFDVNADTGMTENLRVDPSAIYGTYQLLNRQQAQNIENARATAIERGLGAGGGLGMQLQSQARYAAGQQDAQFSSQLTDQFTDLATQQQQAKQAYDAAKYQAELDKIRMAISNGNYGGPGTPQQQTPVQTQYVAPGSLPTAYQNFLNKANNGVPTTPRDFLNL